MATDKPTKPQRETILRLVANGNDRYVAAAYIEVTPERLDAWLLAAEFRQAVVKAEAEADVDAVDEASRRAAITRLSTQASARRRREALKRRNSADRLLELLDAPR
jgi:hypothetical protein